MKHRKLLVDATESKGVGKEYKYSSSNRKLGEVIETNQHIATMFEGDDGKKFYEIIRKATDETIAIIFYKSIKLDPRVIDWDYTDDFQIILEKVTNIQEKLK